MEYRLLGNTDLRVSVIGIGSLGFSRARAVPEEIERMVNRALDLGINIIDTAYAYGEGEAEKQLAELLNIEEESVLSLPVPICEALKNLLKP